MAPGSSDVYLIHEAFPGPDLFGAFLFPSGQTVKAPDLGSGDSVGSNPTWGTERK